MKKIVLLLLLATQGLFAQDFNFNCEPTPEPEAIENIAHRVIFTSEVGTIYEISFTLDNLIAGESYNYRHASLSGGKRLINAGFDTTSENVNFNLEVSHQNDISVTIDLYKEDEFLHSATTTATVNN